jgi:hypothetical protein
MRTISREDEDDTFSAHPLESVAASASVIGAKRHFFNTFLLRYLGSVWWTLYGTRTSGLAFYLVTLVSWLVFRQRAT